MAVRIELCFLRPHGSPETFFVYRSLLVSLHEHMWGNLNAKSLLNPDSPYLFEMGKVISTGV